MGQWRAIARYATAITVLHYNKLMSTNSLFLIIFNNLYILYSKVQILANSRKRLFALQHTSKNCLERTRKQKAEEWGLILMLG